MTEENSLGDAMHTILHICIASNAMMFLKYQIKSTKGTENTVFHRIAVNFRTC
jgi:hypothetical protein